MEDARPYLAVVYSLCFMSLWGENKSEILTQNNKCFATVSPESARKLVTNILLHEFYVHVTVHRNKFLCNKTN
jgi:hypothetical protein